MSCSASCYDENLNAYGDIAGIGVLLSFLVSALMLILFVLSYYLIVYDPDVDPWRKNDEPFRLLKYPNPVDRAFLYVVRKLFSKTCLGVAMTNSRFAKNGVLENALVECARMFSDIQIFTGIAILVSGFKAYACDLQSYHWQIVIYMAWLAFVTHAAVLSSLRHYLLVHRRQLWWRFGGMFINAAMLVVAVAISANFGRQMKAYKRLAKCTEEDEEATRALETKVKLITFLVYGFVIRVLKLVKGFHDAPRRLSFHLRQKLLRIQCGYEGRPAWDPRRADSRTVQLRVILVDPILIAFFGVLHIHLDLLTSFMGEVFWLVVSCTWATKRLFTIRGPGYLPEENEWTFGQIFPIMLLAAPIVALISNFVQHWDSNTTCSASVNQAPDEGRSAQFESDGNLPTAETGRQTDSEYESGISFRGGSILVGFTYLHIVVFVLAGDVHSRGIATTIAMNAFTYLVVHPSLQATWLLYSLWIPKLSTQEHRTIPALNLIFMLVLLLLAIRSMPLAVMESEAWYDNLKDLHSGPAAWNPVLRESLVTMVLLIAYTTFLGWFGLDCLVERMETSQESKAVYFRVVSLSSSVFLLAATSPVFISQYSMFSRITLYKGTSDSIIMTMWCGMVIGLLVAMQLLVELVELAIRRWTGSNAALFRAAFLTVAVIGILIATCYGAGHMGQFVDSPFWTVPIIVSCQIWLTCSIGYDVVSSIVRARAMNKVV